METPSEPAIAFAVLLLACAAVAAVVAATVRGPHLSDWRYWMLMSVALVALSADEAASLHELLVGPLRALVGGSPWLRYPLILPGLGVVAAGVPVRRQPANDSVVASAAGPGRPAALRLLRWQVGGAFEVAEAPLVVAQDVVEHLPVGHARRIGGIESAVHVLAQRLERLGSQVEALVDVLESDIHPMLETFDCLR